jgi:hypothetical protein
MEIKQNLLTKNRFSRPGTLLKGVRGVVLHWVGKEIEEAGFANAYEVISQQDETVPGEDSASAQDRLIINNGASWVLCVLLVAGCQSRPIIIDDAPYRSIERQVHQTSTSLAIIGADIAAGVDRIDHQAARVISGVDGLGAAIGGSGLDDTGKEALLHQVAGVQREADTLMDQVAVLRKDAGRLNDQLAEQRELNTALQVEHDRREAAAATVQREVEATLAKVKGQCNLYLAILLAVGIGVLGYIALRVFRILLV